MSHRLVAVFTPFEDLTDTRMERTRAHNLFELVVVAVSQGKRESEPQREFWLPTDSLTIGPGNVFYNNLEAVSKPHRIV